MGEMIDSFKFRFASSVWKYSIQFDHTLFILNERIIFISYKRVPTPFPVSGNNTKWNTY